MFVLKVLRDVASLMLFGNFDHNLGPRYLIECLPYFTELNLGIVIRSCYR